MALIARFDAIGAEARKLRFGRAMLTLAIAPFFAVGWLLGKVWLSVAWVIAAIRFGWREAHGN